MEIGSSTSGQVRFTDLSQSQQIDLRIEQVFQKQDRNTRRDLLRANLALKNSVVEMQRLIKQGSSQTPSSNTAETKSNNSLGLTAANLDEKLTDVTALSSISDGNFKINGKTIEVDTANDSLNDVLDRINNASTGVTATYNSDTDKIELTSTGDFVMNNISANFFNGLDINSGTVSAGVEKDHANFYKNSRFTEAFNRFTSRLNTVFNVLDQFQGQGEEMEGQGDSYKESLTTATQDAITKTVNSNFSSEGFFRLKTGLTVSFNGENFIEFSTKDFNKNIVDHYDEMEEFFGTTSESGTEGGFLEQLTSALNTTNSELETKIASYSKIGLLVNTLA
jgi:hypothetical protein